MPKTTLDLDSLTLATGAHNTPQDGMCVMEAVAFLAGEKFSDHPVCASPVISAFLRSWNDTLPTDQRQELKRYVPLLVGSAGTPEQEADRVWMALDWLVRDYTPIWLRLAGLNDQADRLAGLPELVAGLDVPSVRLAIDAVRKDAAAAWAAAWGAAGDAAWDAAWDAARDAARAAARGAARDAARAAARDAARGAARDAAWDAAWDAARGAAWGAARGAARDAAGDAARGAAGAAARGAAGAALQPAVTECQQSAHRLVARMLAVTAQGVGNHAAPEPTGLRHRTGLIFG